MCVLGHARGAAQRRASPSTRSGRGPRSRPPRSRTSSAATRPSRAAARPRSWRTPPTRSSRGNSQEATGNFYIDDAVLEAEGVTDFDKYRVDPRAELVPDFFVSTRRPKSVPGPEAGRSRGSVRTSGRCLQRPNKEPGFRGAKPRLIRARGTSRTPILVPLNPTRRPIASARGMDPRGETMRALRSTIYHDPLSSRARRRGPPAGRGHGPAAGVARSPVVDRVRRGHGPARGGGRRTADGGEEADEPPAQSPIRVVAGERTPIEGPTPTIRISRPARTAATSAAGT